MELSEARKKANKKWDEANAEKKKLYTKKSHAKSYIFLSDAKMIEEVKEWIKEREKQIEE